MSRWNAQQLQVFGPLLAVFALLMYTDNFTMAVEACRQPGQERLHTWFSIPFSGSPFGASAAPASGSLFGAAPTTQLAPATASTGGPAIASDVAVNDIQGIIAAYTPNSPSYRFNHLFLNK